MVQVTDAIEGYVRVGMLVSAPNAPALFDLRCDVREGMVQWLQRAHPGALPRKRIEHESGREREIRSSATPAGRTQADSGLFTGNSDAERRGRAFDQTEDVAGLEREFARARYDGG